MDQNNWSCVLSVPSMDMTQGGLSRAVEGLYASLQLLGQREASLWYGRSANPIPLSDGETRMLTLRQLCKHGFRRISPHAIVHDNGIWKPWNLCVSHLALSRGAKLVVSTHGMLSPWALSDRKWKKRVAWLTYQKRILRSASLIFATSEIEVEWIRQCGIDVPIALIPNGIDVPDALPAKDPVDPDKYALFLSRLHPVKGLEQLIDAWATIRPGISLKIAGTGQLDYTDALKARVRERGLDETVEFVGHLEGPEKLKAFENSEFFVLPSHSENFGIVVAEALAAGIPVVTTEGTPWGDLNRRGCGWCTELGLEPLIKGLEEALAKSPDDLKAMGRRGQLWMKDSFSWRSIAEKHLEAYRWVFEGCPELNIPDFIHIK